ncbi:MAG: hypothetical protein IPO63_18405 [Bacteroidetes bacterium]|nr:hypothetical protein [Bacteroidota bacterium]
MKVELIRVTDKMEATDKMVPLNEMKAKDDYDNPTRIMCGDKQDGRNTKQQN